MYFNVERVVNDNEAGATTNTSTAPVPEIEFRSTPIHDGEYSTKTCQPLKSNFSIFNMKLVNNTLQIKYVYHIDLQENLPSSMKNIAGIFNKEKNVLGMMPHPERMIDESLSGEDGSIFFKNLLNNIK